MDRRQFLAGTAVVVAAGACSKGSDPHASPEPAAEPEVIRIASVKTAVEGGVLPALVESFEKTTRYRVRVTTGTKVYDAAREGSVDLVISHYGHRDAEAFVLAGAGEWPRMIFSNQMALVGPPADPAGVRGMTDLAEAFRRIATTKSPFVINDIDGVRYLTEILWNAIGRPERDGWMIDSKTAKDAAIAEAASRGAYTLWGFTPFLRATAGKPIALEPLVLDDPLLQRMMVSIVVKSGGVRRVNTDGALAFQTYLLRPATQAAIRTTHYPGQDASWIPAGRHNRTAMLPKT